MLKWHNKTTIDFQKNNNTNSFFFLFIKKNKKTCTDWKRKIGKETSAKTRWNTRQNASSLSSLKYTKTLLTIAYIYRVNIYSNIYMYTRCRFMTAWKLLLDDAYLTWSFPYLQCFYDDVFVCECIYLVNVCAYLYLSCLT